MDPVMIATTVVNLLLPYLTRVAESLTDKTAEMAWHELENLFTTVKKKFSGNAYAEETLNRVKDDPQSKSRQAALAGVLEEQIKQDPDFASDLQKLLKKVEDSGGDKIIQNVTIGGKAKTGNVITIGKNQGAVDQGK